VTGESGSGGVQVLTDRARRHTRYFLGWARSAAPVHLAADVDMTEVVRHRDEAARRYSVVSYLLRAGARAMAAHPEANAAAFGGLAPRVARYRDINAKLALDRRMDGRRVVLTTVVPGIDGLDLDAVQDVVDHCRDADPDTVPGAGGVRLLQRLPAPLGRLAFRAAVGRPAKRPTLLGTFAVSSLGHSRADTFHSFGGTAVTLSAGRIAERPVVREGQLTAAPVMRLGLTFDHRVLDGAAAAELLDDLVDLLEACRVDLPRSALRRELDHGDAAPHAGTSGTVAAGT
jgi:pyruvate/2-oxoglutarate dehydrogenase complex dihydrolipoamide acyltransferase (E2) component